MEALVQLAGTVAHELNNIFTAVTGNLSLLDPDFSDDQSATYKDILRATQRGIDLTAKLQAFAGRQRLVRRNIEVNSVVTQALEAQRPALGSVSIMTAFALEDLTVYADAQKLFDTIVELIRNAGAAMPQTGGRLVIKTERYSHGNGHPHVLLSISDNGCGMAPDVIARAQEPLFTTTPQGVRTGWGLSNASGFFRQSGGTMTLHSEPGRGTTVRATLPLEDA